MKSVTGPIILAIIILTIGCGERSHKGNISPVTEVSPQPTVTNQISNNNIEQPNSKTEAQVTRDANSDFNGTAEATEKKVNLPKPALLKKVRTGNQKDFDRVVLEFAGDSIPGYHIEYSDKPAQQCGSGKEEKLKGNTILEIRLDNTNAHYYEGYAVIAYTPDASPDLPIVKEIKRICDFEAQVELAIGAASQNEYRVLELKNPSRLVIDIKH